MRTEGSVPHIYGANLVDVGRVFGFVQARDRFFFMDAERRLAFGTIAELFGELALGQDVESRMTGQRYVTERMVEHLSPEFAAYLTAFAEGVNAYIDAVRAGELPGPTETQFAGVLGYASPADMMKPFALRDVAGVDPELAAELGAFVKEVERVHGLRSGVVAFDPDDVPTTYGGV